MIEVLLQPLQSEFMLKAIGVSVLIGLTCAALSCFVTLKGWSLMGDALSHAVVPGVSIAYAVKTPFALGAFASGMIAAGVMGFVKERTRLREDAVIGIVFTTFFALGLLLISLFPASINLKTIVFGNILGIADADVAQVVAISVVTLGTLAVLWKDLALFLFDPSHARAVGLKTRFLHGVLLTLLAATAVASLQAVGACLVVAMLVTPGATAYLLTDRFGVMMVIAMMIGVLTAAVGGYASYFVNGSTGGCIVVLQTLLFLITLAVAPKHGVLAARRRRSAVQRAGADAPDSVPREGV
ncbi:MAG TPA: metal ABC transporter permease [Phycisphaerales bacterium]|nr:metal ABC transporter permease [Phycisphaerales bacterium]